MGHEREKKERGKKATPARDARDSRDARHKPTDARNLFMLALALAVFALIIRIVYILESSGNPFRHHLGLDPRYYDEWARAILSGRLFAPGPFLQAPLYPYFLAACYTLVGPDPVRPLWIQAILGAATVLLGSLIAGRLWGTRALIATGILLAFYKPAIFYTGVLLVPVLATFLLALCLYLAVRRPFAAGIACGFATLAHPIALPGAAIGAGGLATERNPDAAGRAADRGERRGGRRKWAPTLWKLAIGLAIVILPVTVYNLARSGALIPISANTGINLYIGNGPTAEGYYTPPAGMLGEDDLLGINEAQRLAGHKMSAAGASGFWTRETLRAVAKQPGRAFTRFFAKIYLFLHAYEAPQVESLDFEKRYSTILRLPFLPNWIVLVVLAAGAFALRPGDRRLQVLGAAVLGSAFFTAIFFVTGRFRYPAHLLLALMSGAGISAALSALGTLRAAEPAGRSTRRHLPYALIAVAAAVILFAPNWLGINRQKTFAQYEYRLGVIAEQENRPAEARADYAEALRIDPDAARAAINLGVLTARSGDLAAAESLLTRGVALDPHSARAFLALGQIAQVRGDLGTARDRYSRAYEADTTFLKGLEALATTTYLLGDTTTSLELCARLVTRAGSDPLAIRCRFILDRAALRHARGLPVWRSTLRAEADLANAVRELPRATALYTEALARDPRDIVAHLEVISIAHEQGDSVLMRQRTKDYLDSGGSEALLRSLGLAG